MCLPLLEKPSGGYRPVLLCPALIRLWERLRLPMLDSFHAFAARPYWALSAGFSTEEAVYEQALLCEEADAFVSEGIGVHPEAKVLCEFRAKHYRSPLRRRRRG